MAHYITSTMSADVKYVIYKQAPTGFKVKDKAILVKGKANIADKKTLLTPHGTVTKVSSEELELLKNNPVFKSHVDGGYLVVSGLSKSNAEGKAKNMKKKDKSAQLTDGDFKKKGKKSPTVGQSE